MRQFSIFNEMPSSDSPKHLNIIQMPAKHIHFVLPRGGEPWGGGLAKAFQAKYHTLTLSVHGPNQGQGLLPQLRACIANKRLRSPHSPVAVSPQAERPFWTGAKTLCNTYSCRSRWVARWDAPSGPGDLWQHRVSCQKANHQQTGLPHGDWRTTLDSVVGRSHVESGDAHDVCRWHSTRNAIAEFHLAMPLTPAHTEIASRKVCK